MAESPFFDERPILEPKKSKELSTMAAEILDFISRQDRQRGVVVIGVMGGRGSGKTSVLEILGRLALTDRAKRFAVPVRERDGSDCPVLFEPERLHPSDDLLFQLLDYLSTLETGGDSRRPGPLVELERLATRRAAPERFLKMAEETATSAQRLPDRLVDEHTKFAAHNRLVRAELGKFFHQVLETPGQAAPSNRWVILLVDDLDLQPQRALELVELLHRVMDHPGVVVVIAGHEPQLVSAIQRQLKREARDGSFLGQSIVDKRIPHRWHLESWPTEVRLQFMLETVRPPTVLERWWKAADADINALSVLRHGDSAPIRALNEILMELLAPLLPDRPRGLKALHNRLVQDEQESYRPNLESRLRLLKATFSVPDSLVRALHSVFRSVEVGYPSLRLDHALTFFPEDLRRGLAVGSSRTGGTDSEPARPFVDLLSSLGVPTDRSGPDLPHISAVLQKLARTLSELQIPEITRALLAISLDASAKEDFRADWQDAEVRDADTHEIRLHPDAQLKRGSVEELRSWLAESGDRAQQQLQQISQAIILVAARAPLSALVYWGWRSRYLRCVEMYNRPPGQARTTRFELPLKTFGRISDGLAQLTLVEPMPADGLREDAVLLVDLLGKATEAQLGAFEGAPPGARRVLVRRHASAPVAPADLGPLLQDTVEILGRLRDEGVKSFHLGLLAPDVYAFALGRQLHAQGEVVVYEWERPSGPYRLVCALIEPGEQAPSFESSDTGPPRDTED